MDHFTYKNAELHCESVPLRAVADAVGTPAYIYSRAALLESYGAYDRAFAAVPHVICYAVKANANLGVRAPVGLRVNPDVDPQTHPYISTGLKTSKFGIPIAEALAVYDEAARLKGVEVLGVQMHVGSQLTKTTPFADAGARLAALAK